MMKKIVKFLFSILTLITMTPLYGHAAQTTGGGFGGTLQIVQIGREIINFLSGPAGIIIITIGIIGGGIAIIFGRQRDQGGYRRIGQTLIGGAIIVAAASLVGFFFSGAMI
jgi:type IV secretory pathway VirB2 component (pilin)